MEQPPFIKCEPDWQSDTGGYSNFESSDEAATDKLVKVKPEAANVVPVAKTGKLKEEFIKEEHGIQDVKEEAGNEACILNKAPSCAIQALLSTGIVKGEVTNSDDLHIAKEISESNHTEDTSSVADPVAPLFPDEEQSRKGLVLGKTLSEETLLKKHQSVHNTDGQLSPSSLSQQSSVLTDGNDKFDPLVTNSDNCTIKSNCSHSFQTLGKKLSYCKTCGHHAYCCSMCDKYFTHRSSLYRHQRIHPRRKLSSCSVCGITFNSKSSFSLHMLAHADEKVHKCTICGKAFSRRSHLRNHMFHHTEERLYSCRHCNLSFSRKITLMSHLLTHTSVTTHRCTKCGKEFERQSKLREHFLKHTKELPWICTVCGKAFALHLNLRRHMFTHCGERCHSCPHCSQSFTRKFSFIEHLLTHSHVTAYKCKMCGKGFGRIVTLREHVLMHTEQLSWTCTVCGKIFTKHVFLEAHKHVHEGDKLKTLP